MFTFIGNRQPKTVNWKPSTTSSMDLITLYKKESEISGVPALITAIVSGVAQGALLGIIIRAASTASHKTLNFRYFLMFAITFAIVVVGKRHALKQAMIIAEEMVKKIRIRIGDKIRNTELLFLENMGREDIFTRIAQDTSQISEAAILIINACQSAIVLVFSIFLLALLSKIAFAITIIAIATAVLIYLSYEKSVTDDLIETTRRETRFFEMLNQIINGFKELKINQKKNDHHFQYFEKRATRASEVKIQTGHKFITQLMFSQVFFYTLLGIIIFILPRLGHISGELVIRVTSVILFIIGPMNLMVTSIPVFARANNAIRNLYILEERLDKASNTFDPDHKGPITKIANFNELRFESISFSYTDRHGTPLFTVGPLDLTLARGEILFIVGGNGSGKTTLLKLLTGLYYPISGTLGVDDLTISAPFYPAYRDLFSIIFGEFYLFDRLYGLDTIDEKSIRELLKRMLLENKTELVGDAFSNIQLSTGQRKRLAMIVALLDNKQIYIFDEWAADQDPIFREYFYEVLLSDLKAHGKTVIAVSHDDRYFHYADRVLKMEFGKFVEINEYLTK